MYFFDHMHTTKISLSMKQRCLSKSIQNVSKMKYLLPHQPTSRPSLLTISRKAYNKVSANQLIFTFSWFEHPNQIQ